MYISKILCFVLLSFLISLAIGAKELTFENPLRTLEKRRSKSVKSDRKVTLGGKPSIYLRDRGRVEELFTLEKDARYELTYFVKGRNVEDGPRKGTVVLLNVGKGWYRFTASENRKPDSGTFDWRKGRGIIDCAALKNNKVKILLVLRGSGEAWYSNIRLKKLPPSPKQAAAKKISFNIKFFPAYMDDNKVSFCENLPGMLEIVSSGKGSYKGRKGSLTILTPAYVKLLAACETLTLSKNKRRNPAPFTVSSVMRSGKKYNKYVIPYNPTMLAWINMNWYRHILYFETAPGSASKTDRIYYSAQIGKEVQKEQSLSLKILPAVKFPRKPCKEFGVWVNQIQSRHVPIRKVSESYIRFWSSLSEKRYKGSGYYRDRDIIYPGFSETVFLGGGLLYNTLVHNEVESAAKLFPKDVDDQGRSRRRRQVSTWSLLDDPNGHYDRHVRDVLRKLKNHYKPLKHILWDFEPHPWGYDEGGRKRFAKKLGLKKVPTIAEVHKHYSEQWFKYMVNLHAEFVAKTVRIIREELPGTKFWYCSDNLHANGPRLARWCGIDVSLSDDITDYHIHMPYYASTRYFDDIAYNIASLKKPNFPLIDPAERLKSFYSQYSGPKITQNIAATAALGGIGIGFWPDDVLQGEYYHGIAKGFSLAAQGEEFYKKGVRCDRDFKVVPRNVVSRRLADGKVITYPDFSNSIRYTAHRLQGEYLLTVFNYDTKRTLIAEINSSKMKPFLVKIPANGCVLVKSSDLPPQDALRKEIRRFNSDSSIFLDQQKGENAIRWNSTGKGVPVLEMSNGHLFAGVDAFARCNVVTFRTADQKEYFHNGFAGRLVFNDPSLGRLPFRRTSHGFTGKENIPFVETEAVIPQYTGGAASTVYPLYGMTIRRRMELHKDRLVVTHTFRNGSKKAIRLNCRLGNYPYVGYRFKAENVFLWDQDRTAPMNVHISRRIRKGENIVLKAVSGVLNESISFIPGDDYEGLFIWTLKGDAPRKTVEFTVNKVVKPGETLVRSYSIMPEKR